MTPASPPQLPHSGRALPEGQDGTPERSQEDGVVCLLRETAGLGGALAALYLFNVVFMVAVGRGVLVGVGRGTSLGGWLAALLAMLSNSLFLNALVLAPVVAGALLVREWWFVRFVAPVPWAVACALVYADSVVFRLFRLHLYNGLVLNLLSTPGASDSVTAGTRTVLSAVLAVGFIFVVEIVFASLGLPFLQRRGVLGLFGTRRAKLAVACAAFVCVLADKTVYAVADLADRTDITGLRHLFPLYQPVTMRRFASKALGVDLNARVVPVGARGGGSLDYPRSPISFRPGAPAPNVVILCIEGARFDVLRPDVMPNLHRFAEDAIVFERHYSAGNCSRFGIFGLLYGVDGTYWHRFLAERRGPVLVSELRRRGYEFAILSCTDLNFPEFRQTAFVEIPEAIVDRWDCPRVERDRLMTDRFVEFLSAGRRPFFAFLFYDASHQPYLYPPEHGVFPTELGPEIDYVAIASNVPGAAAGLRARYLNSLHYIDSQLARVFEALEERRLLDETLVFVTGDHGEEFGELGLFGHNTSFTRYQAGVIMVARIPGERPRRVNRLTSHVDVVPTIMSLAGAANPVSDYSQGTALTSAEGPEWVFAAGWDAAGIVDDDSIASFGLEFYNADLTITDLDARPCPDRSARLAARRGRLLEVLDRMRAFTRGAR